MRLDDQIELLQPPIGRDGAGDPTGEWVPLPPVWANVLFLSGVETLRAGAEVAMTRASIRVWADPDITTAMRARFNGVDYDIKSALPDSRDRRFMFLVCEGAR